MKHILFTLLSFVFIATSVQAQDSPKKMLRNASKDLGLYNLDPATNADKLQDAKMNIDKVVETAEYSESYKAWQTYGEIYNEIGLIENKASILPEYELTDNAFASFKAFSGLLKAKDLAVKKFEKKDVLSALKIS